MLKQAFLVHSSLRQRRRAAPRAARAQASVRSGSAAAKPGGPGPFGGLLRPRAVALQGSTHARADRSTPADALQDSSAQQAPEYLGRGCVPELPMEGISSGSWEMLRVNASVLNLRMTPWQESPESSGMAAQCVKPAVSLSARCWVLLREMQKCYTSEFECDHVLH